MWILRRNWHPFSSPTSPSYRKHTVWEWISELRLFGKVHTTGNSSCPRRLVKFWGNSQSSNMLLSAPSLVGPWGEQVKIKFRFWLRAYPHPFPVLDFLKIDFCLSNFYSLLFSIGRTKSPSKSWKVIYYFTGTQY